jgi:hypothetical protein
VVSHQVNPVMWSATITMYFAPKDAATLAHSSVSMLRGFHSET